MPTRHGQMSGEGDDGRVTTKGEGDDGRVTMKGEGDDGRIAMKGEGDMCRKKNAWMNKK